MRKIILNYIVLSVNRHRHERLGKVHSSLFQGPSTKWVQISSDVRTLFAIHCANILNSLTGYANSIVYLIYGQFPVIHHDLVNTITIFVVGGRCKTSRYCIIFQTLPSLPKFSFFHIWTGAFSPNAATMSAWIFLGAMPFSCRGLITPRCQIFGPFSRQVATGYS